jgi:hypothetical protein
LPDPVRQYQSAVEVMGRLDMVLVAVYLRVLPHFCLAPSLQLSATLVRVLCVLKIGQLSTENSFSDNDSPQSKNYANLSSTLGYGYFALSYSSSRLLTYLESKPRSHLFPQVWIRLCFVRRLSLISTAKLSLPGSREAMVKSTHLCANDGHQAWRVVQPNFRNLTKHKG